jgi:hypothetical protein
MDVFRIHLNKRGRDPQPSSICPPALVASEKFSGAEIEEAIISALYDAFYARKELTTEQILTAVTPNRAAGENHGRTHQHPARLGRRPRPQRQRAAGTLFQPRMQTNDAFQRKDAKNTEKRKAFDLSLRISAPSAPLRLSGSFFVLKRVHSWLNPASP